jgi:hypothetical protein
MKRIIFLVCLLAAGNGFAQLLPDAFTLTWTRTNTTAYVNTNVYLSDVTYRLTNCIARNGVVTQDLTGCGIQIRVGDASTNRLFTGWIENTNGTFGCDFTIPKPPPSTARSDIMTTSIQLTLTNGAIYVTDRELKQLYYANPLR